MVFKSTWLSHLNHLLEVCCAKNPSWSNISTVACEVIWKIFFDYWPNEIKRTKANKSAGRRLGLVSEWRRGLCCVFSGKQLGMSRKDWISEEIWSKDHLPTDMRRPDLRGGTPAVLCLKQSDVFGLWQKRQTPSLNRKIPPSAAFCTEKPFFPS